jgi:aminoglycoside phosphotransferase (APT) family kinase protein
MAEAAPAAIQWAADTLLPGGRVAEVRGLRDGGMPWLVRVVGAADTRSGVLRLGGSGAPRERARLATEADAVRLAAEHGVAVPRLLGSDLDGAAAGQPALLISFLPGSSRIPASASSQRLERFGAAAARLHTITLEPTETLPLRERPIEIEDFEVGRETSGSRSLLNEAQRLLARIRPPDPVRVLVHGDLWHGNTLWVDDELTAIIDWDSAGVGHYALDLASLRLDAALMFGPEAAEPVVTGWTRSHGARPVGLGYFDVVASLATPPDMTPWVSTIADQGRPDLAATELVRRRDAFLRRALDQLA